MTKYVRNDDMEDDLGVYRGEKYPGMTQSRFKHQNLTTMGIQGEQEISFGRLLAKLSPKQLKLYKLVVGKCKSIRQAGKIMKISQQTAQEYWEIIKEKLQ